MPNPRLTDEQRASANELLEIIAQELEARSQGDKAVHWAMRRRITKELMHQERGTPAHRNKIKRLKREEQRNICPLCGEELPDKYCVLDRFEAIEGYTVENTRLIHQKCDRVVQADKGYT